eukprot:927671-Pyramimonas_sp.AAC.1
MRSAQSDSDDEYGPMPDDSDACSEDGSGSEYPSSEEDVESRCAVLEQMAAFSGACDSATFA